MECGSTIREFGALHIRDRKWYRAGVVRYGRAYYPGSYIEARDRAAKRHGSAVECPRRNRLRKRNRGVRNLCRNQAFARVLRGGCCAGEQQYERNSPSGSLSFIYAFLSLSYCSGWSDPKVHRDFHVEVNKAIYSVHHRLVGRTLRARLDSSTLKLYLKGRAGQGPPPQAPGGKSTDPGRHARPAPRSTPLGTSIVWGAWRPRLAPPLASMPPPLGHAVAWTKMRQVYRLLVWSRSGAPNASNWPAPGSRGRSRRREPRLAHARAGPRRRRTRRGGPSPS